MCFLLGVFPVLLGFCWWSPKKVLLLLVRLCRQLRAVLAEQDVAGMVQVWGFHGLTENQNGVPSMLS